VHLDWLFPFNGYFLNRSHEGLMPLALATSALPASVNEEIVPMNHVQPKWNSVSLSLRAASWFLLALLAISLPAWAQVQTVIHDFVNKDGAQPIGDLVADPSGNLYGTTAFGGRSNSTLCVDNGGSGCGAVFEIAAGQGGGWQRVELYRFTGGWNDGYRPLAGLARDSAGNLYGTTAFGGHYGGGIVFRLSPTAGGGWTETVLYHFGGLNIAGGGVSLARLALDSAGNLYGAATQGGNTTGVCANRFPGCGVVFKLTPASSGLWTETVLYTFSGGSDGADPQAGLIFDAAGNLYGTASGGGNSSCTQGLAYGCGVVFELSPNSSGGWNQTVLYTFTGPDGSGPLAALTFDEAGNLYGTTQAGGSATGCRGGCGVVFELSPSAGGWSETVLHTFQPGSTGWGDANGGQPQSDVYLDASGNIYATTFSGGTTTACSNEGCGVVFKLTPGAGGGWTESVLHAFSGGADGGGPFSGLTPGSAGNLFATTYNGGATSCTGGCGIVYQITP
jgi:uncharacterized repeat protein (TIGR03803 family)